MAPRAVIFDLDETLAESKQAITPETGELLGALLARVPVAIASGGKFETLVRNVVDELPENARIENLFLIPTCGAALYEWKDASWKPVYALELSDAEATCITEAITQAANETALIDLAAPSHGDRIEHRGSQITLSALGQQAPLHEKLAWDPDRTKRTQLRDVLAALLPEHDVKTGGATSIDITKPGINKAYGVRAFAEHLNIPITDMLYVGDALFPGGNDEVVKETGIQTIQVTHVLETQQVIQNLLTK